MSRSRKFLNRIEFMDLKMTVLDEGLDADDAAVKLGFQRNECRRIVKRFGWGKGHGGGLTATYDFGHVVIRRCRVCEGYKPLAQFIKDASRSQGRGYICNGCKKG